MSSSSHLLEFTPLMLRKTRIFRVWSSSAISTLTADSKLQVVSVHCSDGPASESATIQCTVSRYHADQQTTHPQPSECEAAGTTASLSYSRCECDTFLFSSSRKLVYPLCSSLFGVKAYTRLCSGTHCLFSCDVGYLISPLNTRWGVPSRGGRCGRPGF